MILIFKTSAEGEDHRGYSSREQRTSQVQQQLCRIIGNYSQDRKPNEGYGITKRRTCQFSVTKRLTRVRVLSCQCGRLQTWDEAVIGHTTLH